MPREAQQIRRAIKLGGTANNGINIGSANSDDYCILSVATSVYYKLLFEIVL